MRDLDPNPGERRMSPTDLAELAANAASLPEARRTQLLAQLPAFPNVRFGEGVVEGLRHAAQLVNGKATDIRDCVAVAAARLLDTQRQYQEMDRVMNTPQVRAAIEQELARIEAGGVEPIPTETTLGRLEQQYLPDRLLPSTLSTT